MPTPPANSELSQFLTALFPEIGERWVLIWGAPSKKSAWVQHITPEVLASIDKVAARENVYVGCGLRGANLGATERGKKPDVVAIPGTWLDIDFGTEHKKPNLPPTEEEAMQLIREMGPAPSLVVHSGRGLQAWWLFKEPWIFESDEDRTKAEKLTMGWCSTLRARAKAHGWDADQVGDITRVMRLPGTWNRKGVAKKTRLLESNEHRYDPSDMDGYLLPETEEKAAVPSLKWEFDLNPAAEPPAEKFMRLCEIDSAFKSAWEHTRTDLQNQSTSSYDMSLATKALAASWTAQEVVNLLIAHRRLRGGETKTNPRDYYNRTLDRAMAGKGVEERRALADDLKAGKSLPEEMTKDPAEILAVLSERLGVSITKIVRYRSEGNTYQMEVNGKTINAGAIDNFDSQTRFRRLIFDHTDHRIVQFKEEAWHHIMQHLFRAIENVDVQSGTNKSVFENWIDLYLSDGVATEETWQKAAIDNSPFKLKGDTYIVAEGFRRFLLSHMQERITSQDLTMQLTKLGYQYERKNVKNHKGASTKRSVWKIFS